MIAKVAARRAAHALMCSVMLGVPAYRASENHAEGSSPRGLDLQSRVVLNRAIVNHYRTVPVLVLARRGRIRAAADQLVQLGGAVHFRSDAIDYLRGLLPTDRVDTYLRGADVERLEVGFYSLESGSPESRYPSLPTAEVSVPSGGSGKSVVDSTLPVLSANELPPENLYLPTRDIGAPQFVMAHPTFDGRGVGIAIMEQGDFDHPTLRTARTLTGGTIPKIAAVMDPYDPDHDEMVEAGFAVQPFAGMEKEESLVRMDVTVHATRDGFDYDGRHYTAPRAGSYRVGHYTIPTWWWTGKPKQDVAVLWDVQRKTVWVDTRGNGSLAGDAPLRDFNQSHDIGHFASATQSDAMAARGALAFAVTLDEGRHIVHIYTAAGSHSTMVASVAAGAHFLGGMANGVAPGAQVVYVAMKGNRTDRFVEGLLLAAQDPRVDVISSSFGTWEVPEDGQSLLSRAVARIVTRFQKPIIQGGGNASSPGMEQVMGEASAAEVLGVGGYNRRSALVAFYRQAGFFADNEYVSRYASPNGPSAIGAVKPDVIAPELEVAGMPCALDPEPAKSSLASFRLPPCYFVGGGTSSAAPFTAGAIALLVSAAKQTHTPYTAEGVLWAVRMGARRLERYGVYQQGNGLLQVATAWALLQQYVRRPAVQLSFAAPLYRDGPSYLNTPNEGVGLYENGRWHAGDQGKRVVTVVRRGGPTDVLHCRLRLLGSDSTFTVPATIDLSQNKAVEIPVDVRVTSAGVHDAILRLIDSASGLPLDQTGLTVVAGEPLAAANRYTYDLHATIKPGESRTAYVDVPEGVRVIKVQLQLHHGNVRFFGVAPAVVSEQTPTDRNAHFLRPATWTHLEPEPEPGVWQFRADNWAYLRPEDSSFTQDAEFTLHVEAQRVDISPGRETGDTSTRIATRFAPLQTPVVSHGPASVYVVPIGAPRVPQVIDVDVPDHTSALVVRSSNDTVHSGRGADLYLYDCSKPDTQQPCKLWNIQHVTHDTKVNVVRWPGRGQWKVLVDPLDGSGARGLQLSVVIVGSSPGQVMVELPDQAPPTSVSGVAVNYVEVSDAVSDREEELAPLRDLSRYPSSDFLPVPVGVGIESIGSRQ